MRNDAGLELSNGGGDLRAADATRPFDLAPRRSVLVQQLEGFALVVGHCGQRLIGVAAIRRIP